MGSSALTGAEATASAALALLMLVHRQECYALVSVICGAPCIKSSKN